MGRRRARRKRSEDEYANLAIRVERYEATAAASINHKIYYPQHAFNLDELDPVYRFITHLVITGTATYPEDRAGDVYEVTVYGDDAPSGYLQATLEDFQVRDEHRTPQYRTYRGRQVPIYKAPHGLGLLQKERGEARWTAWINVLPRLVSDMLMLLGTGKALYISLQERKHERLRWFEAFRCKPPIPPSESH
jgi:hypothetical protein